MITVRSPWIDTAPSPPRPALAGDTSADVCVIGAGIAGMSTALLLAERGAKVIVIDRRTIGSGTTGYTTAKVTVLHGAIYQHLEKKYGAEQAAIYASAQDEGLALMREWVDRYDIDCDWRQRPAYTYAPDQTELSTVEQEVEAAGRAGVAAEFTTVHDLPYEIAGACVVRDGQDEFHPRQYLLALADALEAAGGVIYEDARATDVEEGDRLRVIAEQGTITADDVVVASHYPFLDRGGYFARLDTTRSYALGVRIRGEVQKGMYLSTASPSRTVRAFPANGTEYALIGGEGHDTGAGDEQQAYERLEAFAREHWDVESIDFHWSSQDTMPADSLPMVGKYAPQSSRLWVATGFQKWGFTNGSAAGIALTMGINGESSPWTQLFNPNRLNVKAGGTKFLKEQVEVTRHFFGDRLKTTDKRSPEELAPGEGGLVRVGGKKVGAYKHPDGRVEAVSLTCTHMGCHVNFNDAEKTWDCPCHGSRFNTDGSVIEGPAVRDLDRIDVVQETGR